MRLTPLVLLPLVLFGGCVVHYGEGPRAGGEAAEGVEGEAAAGGGDGAVTPAGPNLSERYAPLESAFDALMASDPGEDADRRDRLDAARDLSRDLRRGKKDPHELVEAYLRRIAEIESRAVPAEAPVLVIGPAVNEEVVEEAPIGQPDGEVIGEEPVGEPAEAQGGAEGPAKEPKAERGGERNGKGADPLSPPATVESAGAAARDALAKNDYAAALDALRPMKDDERFAELAPLWQEAVDGWVHHERERAGLLFQTSRAWPQAERDAATQEVKGILEGLLRDYPETTYKAAIVRNLQLVERETAAAPK